jgi:hypothetical protein
VPIALVARGLRTDALDSATDLALAGSSSSLEATPARDTRAFGVKVSSGDGERPLVYAGGTSGV